MNDQRRAATPLKTRCRWMRCAAHTFNRHAAILFAALHSPHFLMPAAPPPSSNRCVSHTIFLLFNFPSALIFHVRKIVRNFLCNLLQPFGLFLLIISHFFLCFSGFFLRAPKLWRGQSPFYGSCFNFCVVHNSAP